MVCEGFAEQTTDAEVRRRERVANDDEDPRLRESGKRLFPRGLIAFPDPAGLGVGRSRMFQPQFVEQRANLLLQKLVML